MNLDKKYGHLISKNKTSPVSLDDQTEDTDESREDNDNDNDNNENPAN